ncbi:hypothetical protein B7463_g2969, partial [Scytalidium lignicola]
MDPHLSSENLDVKNVRIAGQPSDSIWNICCKDGLISSISSVELSDSNRKLVRGFVAPSLCHPHIHLDKCFLLSHPKYADLEIKIGDFKEALTLTDQAKARFEHDDLMERGRALIQESIRFGVTHMRAFVEVDLTVGMKCLEVGLALKEQYKNCCYVQICVFAQDPLFSYEDNGEAMTSLIDQAVKMPGVEALGSTPYVEKGKEALIRNIKHAITVAKQNNLHLDFHMDYNLDPNNDAFTMDAIHWLKSFDWPLNKTVLFGHCTRLTLFTPDQWRQLRKEIGELPVYFAGLPTSDMFMMGRPSPETGGSQRPRGTLQVLEMIQRYGLNAAIGINNVGNAFTPQGTCDPLSLASLVVGMYQAGTKKDAELLYQCVSSRAKAAIGVEHPTQDVELFKSGAPANFVLFDKFGDDKMGASGTRSFRERKSIQELVTDAGHDRMTVFNGQVFKMLNTLDDPFFIPRQEWLSKAVQPFADYFGLTTLPLHIHEVLASFLTYTFINLVIGPWISKLVFPVKYMKLSADRRINWDVHVVSLFQSIMISALALVVMFTDEDRKNMTWEERVWGYTGRGGMIQGLATGYFLWDFMITIQHLRLFGVDMLGHAVSALVVFSFGFRPFVNYYASTFILYELSTIFLNFHWFFDKLDLTGTRGQLYNGIVLLITFFGCRLVWGTYQSLRVYQDLWAALHYNPAKSAKVKTSPNHEEMMQFASDKQIPLWLPLLYLASNILLNTLNFHWFSKMIATIRKRFQPPKQVKNEKAAVVMSTGANGNVTVDVDKTEVRRRQPATEDAEEDENEIPPAV